MTKNLIPSKSLNDSKITKNQKDVHFRFFRPYRILKETGIWVQKIFDKKYENVDLMRS